MSSKIADFCRFTEQVFFMDFPVFTKSLFLENTLSTFFRIIFERLFA